MYKLKYYSLTKEEKKEIKNKFYETDLGKDINKRLTRVFTIGIIGVMFSIYLLITQKSIWDTLSGVSLILICLFFILASLYLRVKKINDYLTKTKTSKK